ncbi:MAG: hypothetical protein ACK5Z5_07450 [Neisseriaceae bacterium]|jgi:hypothetical protein
MKTLNNLLRTLTLASSLLLSQNVFAGVCDASIAGSYFRANVFDALIQNNSMIQLSADGNAISFAGEALIKYVSSGTFAPSYGNWKCKDGKVIVTTIGYTAKQAEKSFVAIRDTFVFEFKSFDMSHPLLMQLSSVELPAAPTNNFLKPTAGTLLFSSVYPPNPSFPRPYEKIEAFDSDLYRTQ